MQQCRLSRGRQANTAHFVIRPVAEDAEPGEVNEAVHRSPMAVLSGVFDTEDLQLSTLAEAAESRAEAEAVRTRAELFASTVEIATCSAAATIRRGHRTCVANRRHGAEIKHVTRALANGKDFECAGFWWATHRWRLLRPRDMLALGQLYLADGRWEGRQVVSEDWVTQATEPQVDLGNPSPHHTTQTRE